MTTATPTRTLRAAGREWTVTRDANGPERFTTRAPNGHDYAVAYYPEHNGWLTVNLDGSMTIAETAERARLSIAAQIADAFRMNREPLTDAEVAALAPDDDGSTCVAPYLSIAHYDHRVFKAQGEGVMNASAAAWLDHYRRTHPGHVVRFYRYMIADRIDADGYPFDR